MVLSLCHDLLLGRPGKAGEQVAGRSSVISVLWAQGPCLVVLDLDLKDYFLLECARLAKVVWKAGLGLLIGT